MHFNCKQSSSAERKVIRRTQCPITAGSEVPAVLKSFQTTKGENNYYEINRDLKPVREKNKKRYKKEG